MNKRKIFAVLLAVVFIAGCASVHGVTRGDKQEYILTMRNLALEELFDLKPEAESEIKNAAGYAVFSNINSHLIFLSTGGGYGVAVNKMTGQETYMKMFSLGGGIGLGAKDYRVIIIFRKEKDFEDFIKGNWSFSGQLDAAAKSQEKGASVTGAKVFNADVSIYQLTEAGLIIHATLQGTKYYQYRELN